MFRLHCFYLVLIAVCAYCGVAVGITLDSILINTSCGWRNNIPESNPYELQIDIATTDPTIKAIRITTPAGSVIPTLDFTAPSNGHEWHYGSPDSYATLSELRAQYKTGTWRVDFLDDVNAIIDWASLTYDPAIPVGVPIITNPAVGATGVPLTPTFAWDSVVGTGNALSMQVRPINGDDAYQLLMDLSATQWTPGPLNPLTMYEFGIGNYTATGVSIVGGQPQGPTLLTDHGESFTYLPIFGNENAVNFTTTPEPNLILSLLLMGGITLIYRRFFCRKTAD